MEIIKATLHELDQLTEMNIHLRADEKIDNNMSDSEVRIRMQGFLEGSEYVVYAVTIERKVCGYALIRIASDPTFLRQIYIKPEYRNQGIDIKFLTMLVEKLELTYLDVEALVWNDCAIRFYEEFGFKKRYVGLRYTNYNFKQSR